MDIHIRAKGIEISDHTREHIEQKLESIQHLFPEIRQTEVRCQRNRRHQKGDVIRMSVKMICDSRTFHAEQKASNVEGGIELLLHQLRRQVERYSGKRESKKRQLGRLRRVMKSIVFWRKE